MVSNKIIWGIHTTDDSLFLSQNIIAIGWSEMGDLSQLVPSRDEFKEQFLKTYPNGKKGAVATSAGMLFRFVHEVQIGDYIVFPSKSDRKINLGVIEGPYYHDDQAAIYPNRRKVRWLKSLPRTTFSQGALYEVGSALTFFQVRNYVDEYIHAINGNRNPPCSRHRYR